MFGKLMTVNEVLDEVEKDASFYRNTGGGMTMSGGEVMLQPDFAAALLKEAHDRGIQYGHRNSLQCALGQHRKGTAPCGYDAARPQADDSGAAQKVDRRGQRADSGRTSRKPMKRFPTLTLSPAHR